MPHLNFDNEITALVVIDPYNASGTAQHRSKQVGHFRVKVGQRAVETERER
jgi:hypothetical protein